VDEDRDYKTRCAVYPKRGRGCIEEMLEGTVTRKDTVMDITYYKAYSDCYFTEW
jgi:hypothetical protein